MFWLLLACASATTDDGLVSLSGNLYSAPVGDPELLSGATLTPYSSSLDPYDAAKESSAGNYSFRVAPEALYFLHVQADGAIPSLWQSQAPELGGLLFPVYAFSEDAVLPFFEELEAELGEIDTESGESVQLWGTTRQAMTGEGATIYLDQIEVSQAGRQRAVVGYHLEDGELVRSTSGDPVDWFFSLNLQPGEVTLSLIHPYDPTIVDDSVFFPQGGEIVSAFYTQGF
ncbi:MAG: hypothetical protein VX899_06090 [Myxococcota bacterium]|nr:hypothetical protein [Myxococcota bacterium]